MTNTMSDECDWRVIDELRECIFRAEREMRKLPVRDTHAKRLEHIQTIEEEILGEQPLLTFKTSQLTLLQIMLDYWREATVEDEAYKPDAVQ